MTDRELVARARDDRADYPETDVPVPASDPTDPPDMDHIEACSVLCLDPADMDRLLALAARGAEVAGATEAWASIYEIVRHIEGDLYDTEDEASAAAANGEGELRRVLILPAAPSEVTDGR